MPDEAARGAVHRIIYEELCQGHVLEESRRTYLSIIDALIARGAEGIVLGCTEIMLLIAANHVPVPIFDTTTLHAHLAVDYALDRVDLTPCT